MLKGDPRSRLRAKSALRKQGQSDGFLRESFTLPRDAARAKARAWLTDYPAAAYMSAVDTWRELPDGQIQFTMRRLASAD